MVTATVTVQEPSAGIEPPVRVTDEVVGVDAVPPQVLLALPETTRPTGSMSVKGAIRLAAVSLELVKVIVRVALPPH